jgi:excisionase family DNA binding protein
MTQNAFGTEKEALTTGEVARICNVAARTVSKWIDGGRLEGYRIPGSRDRRVHVSALEHFVTTHGIPFTPETPQASAATRVLIVDHDRTATETVREVLNDLGGYTAETASDALSAAIACGSSAPDVVVFDCSAGDPVAFVSALRSHPNFVRTRFLASGADFTDDGISLTRRGFEAVIRKPYSVRVLLEAVTMPRTNARRAG